VPATQPQRTRTRAHTHAYSLSLNVTRCRHMAAASVCECARHDTIQHAVTSSSASRAGAVYACTPHIPLHTTRYSGATPSQRWRRDTVHSGMCHDVSRGEQRAMRARRAARGSTRQPRLQATHTTHTHTHTHSLSLSPSPPPNIAVSSDDDSGGTPHDTQTHPRRPYCPRRRRHAHTAHV
jgi:hypothetical protein